MCKDCQNNKSCKNCEKKKLNDSQTLNVLSYYQSTLRNAGMFTTLSLATLAAAHSAKPQKNKLGIYARYFASFMFIVLSLFVSWMLVKLENDYENKGDPLDNWKWTAPVLIFTQIAIAFAIIFSFITKHY